MKSLLVMVALVPMIGCVMFQPHGNAELVKRDRGGGVLALRGDRTKAMQDAQQQMNAHCAGPFTIISEENTVVGEQTESASQEQYGKSSTSGATSSVKTNVTEYRITYACGGAQPATAAPAPAGGPQPVPTAPPQ